MTSSTVMNRQAATHVWLSLCTAYVDLRPEVDSSFTFLNELLSSLAIRSIDSDLVVRRTALECCELIFELAQGQMQGQVGQKLIKSEIKEKILTTEVETLYDGAAQFGEIISNFIKFLLGQILFCQFCDFCFIFVSVFSFNEVTIELNTVGIIL